MWLGASDRWYNSIARSLTTSPEALETAETMTIEAIENAIIGNKAIFGAAISSPWSNGQIEGQICTLKLMKRRMHGRGKINLLDARVIGLA